MVSLGKLGFDVCGGVLASHEVANFVSVTTKRGAGHIAARRGLEGCGDGRAEKIIAPYRRTRDDKHERLAPTFEMNSSKPHDRKFTCKVLNYQFERRATNGFRTAEARNHAMARGTSYRAANRDSVRRFKAVKGRRRDKHEPLAKRITRGAASKIKAHGSLRGEGLHHAPLAIKVCPFHCQFQALVGNHNRVPRLFSKPRRLRLCAAFGTALGLSSVTAAHGAVDAASDDAPITATSSPPGPWIRYFTRPTRPTTLRSCSMRTPTCVWLRSTKDAVAGRAVLDALERAWEVLTGALSMPAPDVDPDTLAYDVFLVDPTSEPASSHLEARDMRSRFDRARGFATVDARVRRGCMLDALAATTLARASLLSVAPATDEGSARAQATYLAQLAFPCASAFDVDAIGLFQARRERAFTDMHTGVDSASADRETIGTPSLTDALFSKGASLVWARLDWAFGRSPGALVTASWALHPTMTQLGALRWNDEPDTIDVLRESFKGALFTKSTVDDLWLDVAIARAFVGSADDGMHLPEHRIFGEHGKIPLDWDIPWPKAPRLLSPNVAVYPTGASYLVIRREGASQEARLRVEIDWEEHALFRWAFVKLDARGRELGRVVIPTTERALHARMTLVDLENVDRVMLVGVNVGDPAYRFDPDDEVWEPHAWLVSVAEE